MNERWTVVGIRGKLEKQIAQFNTRQLARNFVNKVRTKEGFRSNSLLEGYNRSRIEKRRASKKLPLNP